eukprot:CAMPEP_0170554694 /NCGR_PEP_ID=MMETSP0211-20121228/12582_1 /TAXON_ID=311385 /ORGANISM="Pseudokeronopsis sp., Strain OXSARD2" /LENGTH=91 /DNA_ID=CAMNT_0010863985 /DNA_START=55 /DNA_END=331 /DNA_ORIENTATION=+
MIFASDCQHARILGATWGLRDVTSAVAHQYNLGTDTFEASIEALGDNGVSGVATLTIVYETCDNAAVLVAKQGSDLTLPDSIFIHEKLRVK